MVTIGIDAHKRSHTAVAVDDLGRKLDEVTVSAVEAGLVELMDWANQFTKRVWAVEDCRHVTSHLERMLCDNDETAMRVPPHMTGPSRRGQRTAGKSDPIDAEAVARACLTTADLPAVAIADPNLETLKTVVAYRDHAVTARTELVNRLRWYLHDIDPDWSPTNLTSFKQLNKVVDRLAASEGVKASIGIRQVNRIIELTKDINEVTRQLGVLVEEVCPELLQIEGCGHVTAATVIVNIGDIDRFSTVNKLTRYAGVAPIPVSSGNHHRMRLHRGGNRQLNAAIHRISLTQSRSYPPAIAYITSKTRTGKSRKEARRALKTHITRRIYRTLTEAKLT